MTRNNYRDYKSLTQHPSDYKSDGTGIVGNKNMRQQMVDIVSMDDGSGKYLENNRREHGGYIDKNKVIKMESGELENGIAASILLPKGYSKFHSHISVNVDELGGYREPFLQYPSPEDIQHAREYTCYVFSTLRNLVYIYNGQGVLSTLPYIFFVNFKK